MYEGQGLGSSQLDHQRNMAKMQDAASQAYTGNLNQREASAIEQSLDSLAKIIEYALMNTDALIERLAPVSCAIPKSGNSNGLVAGGGSCHIESRIEVMRDKVAGIAQKLVEHREALRI